MPGPPFSGRFARQLAPPPQLPSFPRLQGHLPASLHLSGGNGDQQASCKLRAACRWPSAPLSWKRDAGHLGEIDHLISN